MKRQPRSGGPRLRVAKATGPMRGIIAVLVCIALPTGCVGGPHSATTAAPSPSIFTSQAFRYSIAYDPTKFTAQVDRDYSGHNQTLMLPGVGLVIGDVAEVLVVDKEPAGLRESQRGQLQLTAVKPRHLLPMPTLAQFTREAYMRKLRATGCITSPPRTVTLGGLPAFRFTLHYRGNRSVTYDLYHGGFVYHLNITAPSKRWPSVAAALNATLQTFEVAQ